MEVLRYVGDISIELDSQVEDTFQDTQRGTMNMADPKKKVEVFSKI